MVLPEISMTYQSSPSDMESVKLGDRAAFQRIVAAHEGDILAYCLRFLGDRELARDVSQEVFLTLWRQRGSYEERGKLRFYLLRVARLRCLAAAKKRRSQVTLESKYQKAAGASSSESPHQAREDAQVLEQALAKLKPEIADLLILRHLEGLGLDEIREVTGLRNGTIKSRLSRGLALLRKELRDVR